MCHFYKRNWKVPHFESSKYTNECTKFNFKLWCWYQQWLRIALSTKKTWFFCCSNALLEIPPLPESSAWQCPHLSRATAEMESMCLPLQKCRNRSRKFFTKRIFLEIWMKVLFCKIPLVSHKCLEIAPAHQKYYRFFWHKITWCYLYYIDHWIQTNPPSQFLVPEFEHPNHRIIQVANWWCIAVPSPLLGPSPLFKVPQDWSLYHPPTKSASWVPSCLHIEPFKKALGFISLKNQHKNRPLWQTRQRKALSSAGEEKKHAHISPPCLASRDSTAQPGSQSLIIGFGWLFISAGSISDLSPIDLEF